MSGEDESNPILSRLVLILPGFEPVTEQSHLRRFLHEATKTAPHYGVTFSFGEQNFEDGPCPVASVGMITDGDGWQVRTEMVFYGLSRINDLYSRRTLPARLLAGLRSLIELYLVGAACKYLRDGWRFFLFSLFPFFLLAAAVGLLALVGVPLLSGEVGDLAWGVPAALTGFALLALLGKRTHVPLIMDLWALTVDVARNRQPKVGRILDAAVSDMIRRITTTQADEIIVVGHSFGTVSAMLALADPRMIEVAGRRSIGFLSAGSYLLAVAHHPSAKSLRDAARAVLRGPYGWLEVYSLTDPVNFYGTNPADALGVADAKRPSIIDVRFRQQLSAESYRKMRGNFFRRHRQFMYGVEARSLYALPAIVGGPERFSNVVAYSGLAQSWQAFTPARPAATGDQEEARQHRESGP